MRTTDAYGCSPGLTARCLAAVPGISVRTNVPLTQDGLPIRRRRLRICRVSKSLLVSIVAIAEIDHLHSAGGRLFDKRKPFNCPREKRAYSGCRLQSMEQDIARPQAEENRKRLRPRAESTLVTPEQSSEEGFVLIWDEL